MLQCLVHRLRAQGGCSVFCLDQQAADPIRGLVKKEMGYVPPTLTFFFQEDEIGPPEEINAVWTEEVGE